MRAPKIRRPLFFFESELEKQRLSDAGTGREVVYDRCDEESVSSTLDNFRCALQEQDRASSRLLRSTTLLIRFRHVNTVLIRDTKLARLKLGRPDGDAFGVGGTTYMRG